LSLKIDEVLLSLIETEDPIRVLWEALVGIWEVEQVPDNIDDFFLERERVTNHLERIAHECFFELYNLLIDRVNGSKTERVLADEDETLILMDGLSIREASLLSPALAKAGFDLYETDYSFSAIPSDTQPFVRRFFGTSSPSAIRGGEDFAFEYVEAGRVKDFFPRRGKLVVWISFPDQLMHHAGRIVTPSEAFAKTKETLLKVLQNSARTQATITSDHGYIYAQRSIEHCWPPSREDERLLRGIFGSGRAVRVTEVSGPDRRKLDRPQDKRYVVEEDDHYCVVGRYYWSTTGRGSDVSHGGISLTECLVPVLKIRKVE